MREGLAMDHKFRAALNGFNRTDVVNYIEACSIDHEKALRQLRDENALLRADMERLRAELEAARQTPAELPSDLKKPERPETVGEPDLAEQFPEEQELEEVPVELSEPEGEDIDLEETLPEPKAVEGRELEIYRRAEAVERSARQRAAQLCKQVNGIMGSTSHSFDRSAEEMDSLMGDLSQCISRLNDILATIRVSFDETSRAMENLEPLDAESL